VIDGESQAMRRSSFWLKVLLGVAVVALADRMVFEANAVGLNLAILLAAATLALAITRPAVWRDRLGRWGILAAALLALLPAERPSFVGLLLWVLAIAVATLSPRAARSDDGFRWFQRLAVAGARALFLWIGDLRTLLRARARRAPLRLTAVLLAAALPVLGGIVFLELFAAANPVIARWQSSLQFAPLDVGRVVFWLVVAFPLATMLRPRGLARPLKTPGIEGDLNVPGVTVASVTAALVVFNGLFAVQNGLDIAYLWSGAGLPRGVSFADYAHRGAYPLIATALLAGGFVLVLLRPGSATARRPAVRWLVSAWVAQNLFLVASTILRTADYIETYSVTRMRIAALIWMGLVAAGLALILWRVLAAKSSGWLVNANLALLGVVLLVCSLVDFSAITAAWNVSHAREVGGKGVALDLCYMRSLRGGGVVSLAELERRLPDGDFRRRVAVVRSRLGQGLAGHVDREDDRIVTRSPDWRGLRFRDDRRLARLAALGLKPEPLVDAGAAFGCDGSPVPLPPPPTAPLTPAANPRT
jgi:hypothetical protein